MKSYLNRVKRFFGRLYIRPEIDGQTDLFVNDVTPISRVDYKMPELIQDIKVRLTKTGKQIARAYPDAVVSRVQIPIKPKIGDTQLVSIDRVYIPISKLLEEPSLVIGLGDYGIIGDEVSRAPATREDLKAAKKKAFWRVMHDNLSMVQAGPVARDIAERLQLSYGTTENILQYAVPAILDFLFGEVREIEKYKEKLNEVISQNFFFDREDRLELFNEDYRQNIADQAVFYIAADDVCGNGVRPVIKKRLFKLSVDKELSELELPERAQYKPTTLQQYFDALADRLYAINTFSLHLPDRVNPKEYTRIAGALGEELKAESKPIKILLMPYRPAEALYYADQFKNLKVYLTWIEKVKQKRAYAF